MNIFEKAKKKLGLSSKPIPIPPMRPKRTHLPSKTKRILCAIHMRGQPTKFLAVEQIPSEEGMHIERYWTPDVQDQGVVLFPTRTAAKKALRAMYAPKARRRFGITKVLEEWSSP